MLFVLERDVNVFVEEPSLTEVELDGQGANFQNNYFT